MHLVEKMEGKKQDFFSFWKNEMSSLIEEFLNTKKSTPITSSTPKQKPSEYKIDDFYNPY